LGRATELNTSLSIIVPTYNEATVIVKLLAHLAEAGAEEVLVVDGSSADGTAELARVAGARVIEMPPCRALQMNAGARASVGDALLFLHADVRLGTDALSAIRNALRDRKIMGGNLNIIYEGGDLATACFTSVNRARRRWGIIYGDSGIFCRRAAFESLGGFQPWPILEDYDFARRLWNSGKLALLDAPIYVSARRWRNRGAFATMWTWFMIQGLYSIGVPARRLARLYQAVR
jgi:rSAM/selenodomain-associated transferase 2